MTTDLENRLRRYGTTLDDASAAQHAQGLDERAAPHVDELDLSHTERRPRRRTGALIAASGLVAAASVAFVAIVNQRETPAPTAPSEPSPIAAQWPVRTAPGVTPWFELNDEIIATMDLQAAEPGPAQQRLRCTDWTTEADTVICTSLIGEGYLPAVTYPGNAGPGARYVDISTLHADIDAATYATNWSQGKDVGYEDPPLAQQDVTIGESTGRLIESSTGIRRVTWSPQPGVLVAIETGPGFTRDDLLALGSNIIPTSATPSIPLLLATANVAVSQRAIALGGVIDGEVCLQASTGCVTFQAATTRSSALFTEPTEFGIAGLATDAVATVRALWPDGAIADLALTRQPIGTTQVFVFSTNVNASVTLTALDAAGNVIPGSELAADIGPPLTAPPTTITYDQPADATTEPPTASPPLNEPTAVIEGPAPTVPRDVLDTLGITAPVRYLFRVQGMRLFAVTPYDTRTGVLVETNDGHIIGWFDDDAIASGLAYVYRAESPTVVAGIVDDNVTNVIVNDTDIPIVEHGWLALPDTTVSSFTLVRTDGTRQTINLPTDPPQATTAP